MKGMPAIVPFVFERLRSIGAARLERRTTFSQSEHSFLLNLMLGLLAKKGEVSYRNTIPDSNSGTFLTIYIYIVYHFLLHLPAERFPAWYHVALSCWLPWINYSYLYISILSAMARLSHPKPIVSTQGAESLSGVNWPRSHQQRFAKWSAQKYTEADETFRVRPRRSLLDVSWSEEIMCGIDLEIYWKFWKFNVAFRFGWWMASMWMWPATIKSPDASSESRRKCWGDVSFMNAGSIPVMPL